jgi:hypothetical protein
MLHRVRILIWPIRSGSSRTGIRMPNMDLGPPYINLCNTVHQRKNLSLFSTVASRSTFSTICQNLVPEIYKFVAVRVKTNPRTLAALGLFPRYATKKILIGFRVVENPQYLRNLFFYIYGCTILWTQVLKRPIFRREKVFANISFKPK